MSDEDETIDGVLEEGQNEWSSWFMSLHPIARRVVGEIIAKFLVNGIVNQTLALEKDEIGYLIRLPDKTVNEWISRRFP